MMQLNHWWLTTRPKTLSLSVVPVFVGTSLAWHDAGQIDVIVFLAALIAALLIQAGTNLHNDAVDFEKGADGPDRLGPPRAVAQGWFTAYQVKRGAYACFGLAFLIGIYLATVGGWPIILLGLLSLAAGYAYTGGPQPIAYSYSGEIFVFLFFGLTAVMGSYFLQVGSFSWDSMLIGAMIGLMAAAVLLINNYRDLETDERVQKLTLTHYLGQENSRALYIGLILLPFITPFILQGRTWLVLVALPPAGILIMAFLNAKTGEGFNAILARTAILQLVFGILLSIGLIL